MFLKLLQIVSQFYAFCKYWFLEILRKKWANRKLKGSNFVPTKDPQISPLFHWIARVTKYGSYSTQFC